MNNNYTYEMDDEDDEESLEDEEEESLEDEEDEESLEDEEEESLEEDEDDESLEDEEEESLEEEEDEESLEDEEEESLEDEEDDESLEDEEESSLEEEEDEESLEDEEEESSEEEESLEECTTSRKRSRFTTLTKSNIKKLQKTKINEVSSNLSITKSEACLLLIHHGWSATKVDDEERVRKLVGLLKHNSGEIITTQTCQICFDNTVCSEKKLNSAKCGHAYCVDCWKRYINEKIKEGPHECLKLMRCPHPSCEASLEINMIHRFASEQNRKMYDRFLLRSYVETRKNIKWCPRPDCDLAVRYKSGGDYVNKYLEVSCRNGHRFCWGCGEDAHRPVSCEMMAKKNQEAGDSKSLRWISAFTKKCPSCKIPIERNEGCMHVTCTVCSYQFCWLCLSDWFLCSARCNRL